MSTPLDKSNTIKVSCQRTPDRLAIVNFLAEHRALTTSQLCRLLETKGFAKTLRRVQSDLQRLNQAGLVQSFPVSPEIGPRSEMGWILLKPGADWVGIEQHYGNHFRRLPSLEQLAYTGLKLELERIVATTGGWQIEKPQNYNRIQPLPPRTPQYYRLAQALTWQEFHNTGYWPVGDIKGPHTLGLAFKANDYVAYSIPRVVPTVPAAVSKVALPITTRESADLRKTELFQSVNRGNTKGYSEHAVVFILCPPKGSQSFWQARFRQYQQTAGRILVIGVFETEDRALTYKTLLSKGGLRVTTLSRIKTVLEDIWKPY